MSAIFFTMRAKWLTGINSDRCYIEWGGYILFNIFKGNTNNILNSDSTNFIRNDALQLIKLCSKIKCNETIIL